MIAGGHECLEVLPSGQQEHYDQLPRAFRAWPCMTVVCLIVRLALEPLPRELVSSVSFPALPSPEGRMPKVMIGITRVNAQFCRKRGAPKVASCLSNDHGSPLWPDPPLYLRSFMVDLNEHFARNKLAHLRVNTSVHSSMLFEAKWIDLRQK